MLNKTNKTVIIIGSILILILVVVIGIILWYSNGQNNTSETKTNQTETVEVKTTEPVENSKAEINTNVNNPIPPLEGSAPNESSQ